MKKRFMSMLLVLCMVFTLFPSAAFAEEAGGVTIGNTALGTSSVTDSGAPTVCESHKTHTEDCGYIEAVEGIDCSHLQDGTYSCAPVKDSGDVSGNVASPGDAEEAYVCDHSDGCGYKEAVDGADCTHECGLCKPAAKCDCIEECIAADDEGGIEGLINPDCPVCAAEGADLAECKGEAPALLATPRAASAGDKGIFAGRYSHRQVFDCSRNPAEPVQGEVFEVYDFRAPIDSNHDPLPNIAGKIFHFKPSNVVDAPFAFYMMDADGGNDTEIFASGNIYGLGAEGFLYDSGPFGTFISNEQAFNYGESLTYTPDITGPISLAEGEKYAANDQPLGVEVTNTDTSTIYPTLQDAIDVVAEGETLQLGRNLTETVTIPNANGKSFTIDLNGKTLDGGSGTAISHSGTGTLTIEDKSTGKTGTVSSTNGIAIYNYGTGKVTVSSGEVSSTASNAIYNKSTGKVTISGGTVTSTDHYVAIYNEGTGSVTVSDGEVSSTNGTTIYNYSTGTVAVSGGTVSSTNGTAIFNDNGTVTVSGSPVIKGGAQAMNRAPTLGAGVTVKASTDYSGSNLGAYNSNAIASYKYLKFETAAAAVTERTTQLDFTVDSYKTENGVVESPIGVYSKESEGWFYDANSNTLTLNGLNLVTTDTLALKGSGDFKIVLADNSINTITSNSQVTDSNTISAGIDAEKLTILGNTGVLNVSGGKADASYGIHCESIHMEGGVLKTQGGTVGDSNGNSVGLMFSQDSMVRGGSLTAVGGTCGDDESSMGIQGTFETNPDLTVIGGTVNAYTANKNTQWVAYDIAISVPGVFRIEGGTVDAKAGTALYSSIGILADSVLVTGGTLTAKHGSLSYGLGSLSAVEAKTAITIGNNMGIYTGPDFQTPAYISEYTYDVDPVDTRFIISETVDGTKSASPVQITANKVTNTSKSKTYSTLQDAIAEVAEGETLQLGRNLTENVTIPEGNGKSFTIDLNGKTLDGGGDKAISHNGAGTLTIKDSGSNGTITSSSENGAIYYFNQGATDTVLEVIGGTIKNTSASQDGCGIFIASNAKVSISGGTITGSLAAVYIRYNVPSVNLTITGGVLDGKYGVYCYDETTTVSIPSGSPVIKGSFRAMNIAPNTSGYVNVKVVASNNYGGTPLVSYDPANIDYKYLTFEALTPVTEQFTLATGETYYFDLSGEASNIGTINTGETGSPDSPAYPGVPDSTLHYVPFTYAGTVNAYSLESSSSGQTGSSAAATPSNRSLFVADYNVSHSKSWNDLNTANLIFGKNFDTNYKLRSLSVGSSNTGSASDGSDHLGTPNTNEWDSILTKSTSTEDATGWIKNWKNIFSWGQDTAANSVSERTLRGYSGARYWTYIGNNNYNVSLGFRPALEVLNPATLTSEGLKAVELNLNGGSFDSNGSVADGVVTSLNIVCAGGTFTAPSGEGLTRPSGNATTYFKWNTQADGKGTSYAVGASVPKDVTTLYAQWVEANAVTNITKSPQVSYSTLQKAIDAVAEGDTLQLGTDLTENVKIYNTKNFTIDLNGKTLDVGSGTAIDHQGSGTLTITDSLGTGKGAVSSQSSTAISVANGSLTVTGGTIDSTNNSLAISNFGTGKVTVSGGKVSATDTAIYSVGEVTVSGSAIVDSTNGHAIFNYGTSKVSIPSGSPVIKGLIRAMNTAPDTSSYANVKVVASINYDGTDPEATYNPNDIASYKYLTFETGSTQPEATVTTVAVTPKTANVQQGTNQQFNAAVTGTNSPAQTVTWEVTGGAKSGTTINTSGLLTVAADETATSLTVTATSTIDNTKSGTATVTVTTTPVTKYTLTVTGGTGGGSYEAGTSVTVTANTAPGGQRFKEWTATGITLGDKTQNPVTITMPAGSVTLTAIYENIPTGSHTITATAGTGGSISPSGSVSVSAGDIKTFTISASSGYSISSVTVDGVNQGAIGTYTFSNVTRNHTISATFSSNGGGGGGGGGGSSSGGSSNIVVTPPAPDKPNDPTKAEIKVETKVDGKGGATVNVTDKDITDAINKATAEAKKNGDEANGITIVLGATTGNKTVNTVTVNLPKTVQEKVISNKIVSTVVVVDNPDIKIGMDLKAVTEINTQAKSDVTIIATRMDSSKLTGNAKTAIGSRPVFNLSVNYSSGKQVQSFGSGSVSVSIPYTLQSGEVAGGVYAVYVDGNGKVNYITNSSYDANAKVLRFATNHFSVYGIGYKAPTNFTDIASHWAKADIEFVVNRGLMSGTSNTTFAPNSAMTRGMFVTALGRLAGVDVNSYKTGSFTDVKADAYYAPYVNWAASKGITSGTTATTFSPDKTVTRQEMAVLMSNYAKAYGYTVPKTRTEVTFADNSSIGSWAADAVKQMQMAGILNGKDGNKFDPTGTATRGEISAMLHRYVELVIDRTTAEGWTTNDSGSGMYYQSGKAVTGTKTINSVAYNFNAYGETTQKVIVAGENNPALVTDNKKYALHTVKKNEYFYTIAKQYGCNMTELMALNGKKMGDIIHPGDVLKIPQK